MKGEPTQGNQQSTSQEIDQAVKLAKAHLFGAFRSEGIEDATLEEVKKSRPGRKWQITLGFNRPRKMPTDDTSFAAVAIAMAARTPKALKVVTVDLDDPEEISIVNRPED